MSDVSVTLVINTKKISLIDLINNKRFLSDTCNRVPAPEDPKKIQGSATYQIWFRLPIPNPNPKP